MIKLIYVLDIKIKRDKLFLKVLILIEIKFINTTTYLTSIIRGPMFQYLEVWNGSRENERDIIINHN